MLTVYTTMPSWHDRTPQEYRRRVVDVARWTEGAGFRGALIYTDNTLVDAWAAAQIAVDNTERFVPLVAVNPLDTHPFAVAKTISTLAFLHGRQVDLNLVTGGFSKHLSELGCELGHRERYDRLVEYGEVVRQLTAAPTAVTYTGKYYALDAATLSPPADPALAPGLFVSGASDDCRDAARVLDVGRLCYPHQIDTYQGDKPLAGCGIRLGVIARDDAAEAWRTANERFPSDASGEKLHEWAVGRIESHWHLKLSRDALRSHQPNGVYWLYPFRAYRTFCPYLVGTYADVGAMLRRYIALGVTTVILDEVVEHEDLHHTALALDHAYANAG
ncbi:LLM class flavin-dependent oxidoreductase [Kitasatospora purpeofusca]|uniref:LLM class flavin-dependent oxidoreductase n=1 Tax=Kitasatospora purpeofusca TaxID=67352 RepID=UPI002A5A49FF|nr:LLM class flavin-dependent oxidoreductase [Kitasatospora purpeofusca]MDY0814517.1 LLM class flavin-dependent oxidoreductase [Kitasatospora purpeofusca]